MKKGVLVLLGMFMMIFTIKANSNNNLPENNRFDRSINFIENGIEFSVFIDGEFSYNTRYVNNRSRVVFINYDFRGRVNRIENVFINYDRFNNVTRIGNIGLQYYRGRLINVGNLNINYNRFGNPIFYGNVRNRAVNINLNVGSIYNYNDAFFYGNNFRNRYNQIREDNNYFYYRANNNARIGNKNQIIRRRKPASTRTQRVVTKRNDNASIRTQRSTINRNNNGSVKTNKNSTKRVTTTVERTTRRRS